MSRPCTRARITFATYRPSCFATGATPGRGLPFMSSSTPGRVADREDVGMSGDTKVRRNLDAACSVPLGPQPSGRLRGLDACTPDDGAGFDPLVCEQDAGVVAARDHRRKPDLDSGFLERRAW